MITSGLGRVRFLVTPNLVTRTIRTIIQPLAASSPARSRTHPQCSMIDEGGGTLRPRAHQDLRPHATCNSIMRRRCPRVTHANTSRWWHDTKVRPNRLIINYCTRKDRTGMGLRLSGSRHWRRTRKPRSTMKIDPTSHSPFNHASTLAIIPRLATNSHPPHHDNYTHTSVCCIGFLIPNSLLQTRIILLLRHAQCLSHPNLPSVSWLETRD